MVKKIGIRNFLSFKETELDLERRNVLIGPNMSGKSNLINCFKFLATTATQGHGLNEAFLNRGGFPEVTWKGGNETRISFDIIAELPFHGTGKANIYRYAISILGGPSGQFSIDSERLTLGERNGGRTVVDIGPDGKGQVRLEESEDLGPVHLPDRTRSVFEYMGLVSKVLRPFMEFLTSLRVYQLVPALMRTGTAPSPQRALMMHGDNFSSWLMTLQTTEEFQRVRQAASDVFPNLKDILLEPTQFGTISVTTRERHLRRPIGAAQMSDGELVFLALLSLIFAPEEFSSPLFCLEEPENYLHPHLLETLIELLDQRQQELGKRAAQIIATTHSPLLVDKLSLDDLVVVERVDGETKFTRPSSDENLRELLSRKETGLGDLWYSGALGNH